MPHREAPPPELMTDQVLVHEISLHKTAQAVDEVGLVSDLYYDVASHDLVIAGQTGAVHQTDRGKTGAAVKFEKAGVAVSIVPHPGKLMFLNRGGWGSPGCLYGGDGTIVWTAQAKQGVDDIAYGAFENGRKPRFIVGYNGGSGVSMLDESGHELWTKPDGNVWHVETVEQKLHPTLILHSNAGGEGVLRDESGNTIKKFRLPFYLSDFSLSADTKSKIERLFAAYEDKFIWLFSADGEVVAKLPAPIDFQFGAARSIPVSFAPHGKTYQASVVSWKLDHRAVLYLHDSNNRLIYEETFDGAYPAVTVVPGKTGAADTLVVGGKGKIWKYTLP